MEKEALNIINKEKDKAPVVASDQESFAGELSAHDQLTNGYEGEAAVADNSEEAMSSINKRLLEQRLFEERQAASKKEIERAFMSQYEKAKEKILLDKEARGEEKVLNEEDIKELLKFSSSVNDKIDAKKEAMLLEKRQRGEEIELSGEEVKQLEEYQTVLRKLNKGDKTRQNEEIAKQLAIGAANTPASIFGLRSIYSLPAYLTQRLEVRGAFGKGGIGETIEETISASQKQVEISREEGPINIEEAKQPEKQGFFKRVFSKFISSEKPAVINQEHTQVRDSIAELNEKLKMTKQGELKGSEQRKIIAKLLWENRHKDSINEEKRAEEIKNLQKNYIETKVTGVQAARDLVDSGLVGIAATGVGIPAALGMRVVNSTVMDTVARYQTKSREAKQRNEQLKVWEDVFKGAVVENLKEMAFQDIKDKNGKGRTDFQKKMALIAAWGKTARLAGLTALGIHPEAFTNLIGETSQAIYEGKVTMEQAVKNFEDTIAYQADRYTHLAEKTGEYLTLAAEKGGAVLSGAFETDAMAADIKSNVDLDRAGAVPVQQSTVVSRTIDRNVDVPSQSAQSMQAPKIEPEVLLNPKEQIEFDQDKKIVEEDLLKLKDSKLSPEIQKQLLDQIEEKQARWGDRMKLGLDANVQKGANTQTPDSVSNKESLKTEQTASVHSETKPVDIKTINKELKEFSTLKDSAQKEALAQKIANEMWANNLVVGKGSAPEVVKALQAIKINFDGAQKEITAAVDSLSKTEDIDERIKILENIETKQTEWSGKLQISDQDIPRQLDLLKEVKGMVNGITEQKTNVQLTPDAQLRLNEDIAKLKIDFEKLALAKDAFGGDPKVRFDLLREILQIRETWYANIVVPNEIDDVLKNFQEVSHGLNSNFEITLGQDGVPAESERVYSALVADAMKDVLGADGKFSEEEASKILNCAENLRSLIEQHKGVAGIKPEDLKDICDFSKGKLEIKDYQGFNTVINKLLDHSNELWDKGVMQGKGGATAYLDNIKQETWLNKIVHAEGLQDKVLGHQEVQDSDMTNFKESELVHKAKAGLHQDDHVHKPRGGGEKKPLPEKPDVAAAAEVQAGLKEWEDENFHKGEQEPVRHIDTPIRGTARILNELDETKDKGLMDYLENQKVKDLWIDLEGDDADHNGNGQYTHYYYENSNRGRIGSEEEEMVLGKIRGKLQEEMAEYNIKPQKDETLRSLQSRIEAAKPDIIEYKSSGHQFKAFGVPFKLPKGIEVLENSQVRSNADLKFSFDGKEISGHLDKTASGQVVFSGAYQGNKISERSLEFLIEEMKILKEGKYSFEIGSAKPGDIILGQTINGQNPVYRLSSGVYKCVNFLDQKTYNNSEFNDMVNDLAKRGGQSIKLENDSHPVIKEITKASKHPKTMTFKP